MTTMNTNSAQYQREGFLVVEDLLPSDVIKSLRVRITDIGERRVPDFPDEDIPAGVSVYGSRTDRRCTARPPANR